MKKIGQDERKFIMSRIIKTQSYVDIGEENRKKIIKK